jgi:hypothetical protein
MAPSSEIDPLAAAFGFTAEQLAANREGLLAEGQTTPLWTTVLWSVPLSLAMVVLGFVALKYARGIFRVIGLFFGMFSAGVLAAVFAYPPIRDLIEPTVGILEGVVTESTGDTLQVGDQRLRTTGKTTAAADAIVPDRVYRAYYLTNTKRLLSIERADEQQLSQNRPDPFEQRRRAEGLFDQLDPTELGDLVAR